MITVSAPGKLHLIGEHAVVYGHPAIIAAVGARTTVKAECADNVSYTDKRFSAQPFQWTLPDVHKTATQVARAWNEGKKKNDFSSVLSLVVQEKYGVYRRAIIGHVLKRLDIDGGISLEISGDVPPGAGMGSSASLAVSVIKAISEVYKKPLSTEEVNALALELEQFIHGSPSGGDNTAVCYGGLLWFVKGQPPISLQKEVPYTLENFVAVQTKGQKVSTGALVQNVRNLSPSIRDPHIAALGEASQQMRIALQKKDLAKVRKLMNIAQEHLTAIGVSTPEIDEIAKAVAKIGGAAKLCGAGGGGMVLCSHDNAKKLLEVIQSLQHTPIPVSLGVEGVRVERS